MTRFRSWGCRFGRDWQGGTIAVMLLHTQARDTGASRAGHGASDSGDCLAFGQLHTGGGSLPSPLDSSKRIA